MRKLSDYDFYRDYGLYLGKIIAVQFTDGTKKVVKQGEIIYIDHKLFTLQTKHYRIAFSLPELICGHAKIVPCDPIYNQPEKWGKRYVSIG